VLLLPRDARGVHLGTITNRKCRRVAATSSQWPPRTCRQVLDVTTGLNRPCGRKTSVMYMKNQTLNPTTTAQAADAPQPTPSLTPEAIVEKLRGIGSQIPEAVPLTPKQRNTVRNHARTAKNGDILQTTISMVGTTDVISNAVGHDSDGVRQLCDDSNRWAVVEDEVRALLNGVSSANLVRRQQLAAIADTAFTVGQQLARYPEHAALVPHVAEIKRLKNLERRKKAPKTPQSPAPNVPVTPHA